MAYVYLIKSISSKVQWIYVGSTEDVERRLEQHNLGQVISTKGRLPYKLIHIEEFGTINDARIREKEIKSSRMIKENLIRKSIK